jgi:hypothetical protein
MKTRKLWLERAGVALIACIALGTPLALGLFTYLALGDGIDFNAGNPLREGRLWMVRDKRSMVGLGLITTRAEPAPAAGLQCARTQYRALFWSPRWATESNAANCACFETIDGKLKGSKTPCQP